MSHSPYECTNKLQWWGMTRANCTHDLRTQGQLRFQTVDFYPQVPARRPLCHQSVRGERFSSETRSFAVSRIALDQQGSAEAAYGIWKQENSWRCLRRNLPMRFRRAAVSAWEHLRRMDAQSWRERVCRLAASKLEHTRPCLVLITWRAK